MQISTTYNNTTICAQLFSLNSLKQLENYTSVCGRKSVEWNSFANYRLLWHMIFQSLSPCLYRRSTSIKSSRSVTKLCKSSEEGIKSKMKFSSLTFVTLLLIEIFLISQHTHNKKQLKYGSHFLCLFFPTTLLSRCLIIFFLLIFTFFSLFLCTITFFLAFLFFKLSIFTFF